jgi:RNA polymerase primary sigma factor
MDIPKRLDEDSLRIYLREIGKISLLTREEEIELAKKIRDGDREALKKLVASNLRFVVKIAKAYQTDQSPLADLINEGNIGLIKAAERFDERRGVRFISYAIWWIRQTILKSVAGQYKIVRLPMSKARRVRKIAKIIQNKRLSEDREPSWEEIAKELDIDKKEIIEALQIVKRDLSLDFPVADSDTGSSPLSQTIESSLYPSPEELLFHESFRAEMKEALKHLSPREAKILSLYFGLDDQRPHTLEEIGKILGLSRERVRQIKVRALERLRQAPESERLRTFLG